jgi:hypothetical protein
MVAWWATKFVVGQINTQSVIKYFSCLIFILILIIFLFKKFKVKEKIKCIIKLLYVINHIIFDFFII